MTAVYLTHRENYDISQCLKYHSKCLILRQKFKMTKSKKVPFSSSSSEELEDVSVEKSESAKGKKGNESQGKFCKDSLTILLSLWCRMISTPNSGKGTEFFLSTRSEFNSAKMQSTECMEGAEEIQGPDLVTLRLELVTFSFSYSSVISSISSSICE